MKTKVNSKTRQPSAPGCSRLLGSFGRHHQDSIPTVDTLDMSAESRSWRHESGYPAGAMRLVEPLVVTDYPGLLLLNKAFGCLKPSLSDLNAKIIQHQVAGGPTSHHRFSRTNI